MVNGFPAVNLQIRFLFFFVIQIIPRSPPLLKFRSILSSLPLIVKIKSLNKTTNKKRKKKTIEKLID